MANRKVSAFTPLAELDGTELVPVVVDEDPDNYIVTTQQIADLAGGASPTLAVRLATLGSMTMNNANNTYFEASQVLVASADAHYVDGVDGVTPGMLVFDAAGTYRVTVRARITPSSGLWPTEMTLYGLLANDEMITRNARTYIAQSEFLLPEVGWMSELIVNAAAAATLTLGIAVESYNNPGNGVVVEAMEVTAQKIGPYIP
jgi:hypothetical protein